MSGALTGSHLPVSCFCIGMTFFSVWANSAANNSLSVGGGDGDGEGSFPFLGPAPPLPPPPLPPTPLLPPLPLSPFGTSSSSSLVSSLSDSSLEVWVRRFSSSWSCSGGGVSKKSAALAIFLVCFFFFPSSDLFDVVTVAARNRRMILFPWLFGSCSEITCAVAFWHSLMDLFWASFISYFAPRSSPSVFSIKASNCSWSSLTSFSFSDPQMSILCVVLTLVLCLELTPCANISRLTCCRSVHAAIVTVF